MWRSKKFIIIGIVAVVVLAGILGGYAVASANDEDSTQPQIERANLMDKVAEIYEKNTGTAIDSQALQNAFDEARDAVMTDARDQYLQNLVDEGKITQEQSDQYKAWLESRPAVMGDEFKQWLESRPDIPGLFGEGGFGGMMPFGDGPRVNGKMGGGFGDRFRNCLPDSTDS
jgi:type VI protein secretion system component VasK